MRPIDIGDIPGFLLGQAQNRQAGTGCTVILCPQGAVCGVDVRGGSPGTRDTDALDPTCNREVVHSVLLTGGSAYGLDAAGGVMRALEARGIGRNVSVTVVPNVCAAVLFDLKCGSVDIRPDIAMGQEAAEHALAGGPFQPGSYGGGTGATVGKINGLPSAMKGGIGAAAFAYGDLLVGAVVAVNCVGDVVEDGKILAGCRDFAQKAFVGSEEVFLARYQNRKDVFSGAAAEGEGNTVIGCILTNARLTKAQATKLASIGQNGIARAVRPAHTSFDGDTLFAMCSGEVAADPDAVGILAARAVEEAIRDGIRKAESLHGYVALCDLK